MRVGFLAIFTGKNPQAATIRLITFPNIFYYRLAGRVHDYPLEEVLTGSCLLSEWRPDLVKMVLDKLVPENVFVTVIAQKFGEVATEVNRKSFLFPKLQNTLILRITVQAVLDIPRNCSSRNRAQIGNYVCRENEKDTNIEKKFIVLICSTKNTSF